MEIFNDSIYLKLVNELSEDKDVNYKIDLINRSDIDLQVKYILTSYYNTYLLSDGELLKYIEGYRRHSDIPEVGIPSDMYEVGLLMTALKSEQYKRFIRHILCQYSKSIHTVDDDEDHECCICWRPIYGCRNSKLSLDNNMIYSAFTGDKTKTCICVNCLSNLMTLRQILIDLKDKDTLRMLEWIKKD